MFLFRYLAAFESPQIKPYRENITASHIFATHFWLESRSGSMNMVWTGKAQLGLIYHHWKFQRQSWILFDSGQHYGFCHRRTNSWREFCASVKSVKNRPNHVWSVKCRHIPIDMFLCPTACFEVIRQIRRPTQNFLNFKSARGSVCSPHTAQFDWSTRRRVSFIVTYHTRYTPNNLCIIMCWDNTDPTKHC